MKQLIQIKADEQIWSDERGWGINPLAAAGLTAGDVGDVHAVSLRPGAVRGNHYHDACTEWLVIFGGRAVIAWREKNARNNHYITYDSSEPGVYKIPAGIAHAIRNDANHDIFLISFNDATKRATTNVTPLL